MKPKSLLQQFFFSNIKITFIKNPVYKNILHNE